MTPPPLIYDLENFPHFLLSLESVRAVERTPPTQAGHWTDCINPLYKPPHGYFMRPIFPENQKICPVCWHEMIRLEGYRVPVIKSYESKPYKDDAIKHRRVSGSKPEKDSL